jgi:tetratricopeptide (TPR) repeat protein
MAEAKGKKREAEQLYQTAFEYARKNHISDLALEAIAAWTSLSELYGTQHEQTLQVIASALPEARAEGRVDIVFNLLLVRSRAYTVTGRADQAETEMQAIRSEAESLGYVNQLAYALSGLSALAISGNRLDDAANYARQAITLSERLGNDLVLGHTLGLLCSAELRRADLTGEASFLQDSISHGEKSVEILDRLPHSDSLAMGHSYLAEAYEHKKDPAHSLEHFATAVALAEELGLDWLGESLKEQLPEIARRFGQIVSTASPPDEGSGDVPAG